ncbi:putative ubiquitin carboxyl-terminal hydrolase [Moumouvirus australiensis]|uniref:Putative ubiquitin carboxyl-terminal hydrolase n=1 Tax=Moumouvirus australiensis TaxID=2109587 RepID=A0A2P1EM09_9VIRU|nr:putative ubiquitin carboxyl-terminal hydrolase [Moumouvirus australiensis]AVL94923.1 putative ubiquitin carboxyl-terminal hydrolase [Moumouvirus australiensis]
MIPQNNRQILQVTPILDYSGILPITNQIWNGSEYVRISNKNQFINILTSTDPNMIAFIPHLKQPVIKNNIVNIQNNANLNMSLIISTNNFNVENSRALANFGNSCYFGVSMQLLFVMYNLRNFILGNIKITNNDVDSATEIAYKNIKNLLIEMNTSPKTRSIRSFPQYPYVKQQIFKQFPVRLIEEDADEFITRFLSGLDNDTNELYFMRGSYEFYHAATNVLISSRPFIFSSNLINSDIINRNINGTLEQVLYELHNSVELIDGSESVQNISTGDYELGFAHYKVEILPQYLFVRLELIDQNTNLKQFNNIQINTTLTLTTKTNTVTYFALGIIVHRGNTITTGHYTALVYDNYSNNNFEYIFYDDQISTKYSMPITSKIIPKNLYIKNPSDNAFVILYGDITKLR